MHGSLVSDSMVTHVVAVGAVSSLVIGGGLAWWAVAERRSRRTSHLRATKVASAALAGPSPAFGSIPGYGGHSGSALAVLTAACFECWSTGIMSFYRLLVVPGACLQLCCCPRKCRLHYWRHAQDILCLGRCTSCCTWSSISVRGSLCPCDSDRCGLGRGAPMSRSH